MAQTSAQPHQPTSVKETLTSIIIAFAMAFVFRGFIIEAFVIPTGSMAPTLLGAHMTFKSPYSGYEWTQGPREYADPGQTIPKPVQPGITATDPMTGLKVGPRSLPRNWGDRIFVMKYLYSVYDPKRWDVVVFKNPTEPGINFIKRLIGLPNEMVALIDGDVFVRRIQPGEDGDALMRDLRWEGDKWHVARKPEAAQRAMWQLIFSSEYAPLTNPSRQFSSPWVPGTSTARDWDVDRKDYVYKGSSPTSLAWDASQKLIDRVPYNEQAYLLPQRLPPPEFPVGDLRLSLGVRPGAEGQRVSAVVNARGHEFRAEVQGTTAVLTVRSVSDGRTPDGEWKELARAELGTGLAVGKVTNIDFWHVDQSLQLFINDKRVAYAEYDWSPSDRLLASTGYDLKAVQGMGYNFLVRPDSYRSSGARFEFSGGPMTLYRVALGRDIYYTPGLYRGQDEGSPSKGSHPSSTAYLNQDQFFTVGDNSPMSLDARLWNRPDPWVAEIDPTQGVVHRDLLIGKAFLVYFPAPKRAPLRFAPNVGDMRFIW
jgi:signal peptidase I